MLVPTSVPESIPEEVDGAALPRRVEDLRERRLQPRVRIGDRELHSATTDQILDKVRRGRVTLETIAN